MMLGWVKTPEIVCDPIEEFGAGREVAYSYNCLP